MKKWAVVLLAVCVCVANLTTPSPAAAQGLMEKYFPKECRQQQLAGALIGGLAGALLGGEVSDRQRRTEGRVLGGTVGAVIGSQVARASCEKKLRTAMAKQVAEVGGTVTVPEGPLNGGMRAQKVADYVNNEQQTCKTIRVTADEMSTPAEDVEVCLVNGKWRRKNLET